MGTMENSKQKWKSFRLIAMIFSPGIDIIGFDIKIIHELVFAIILYLFLLHIFLEGEY